MNGSKLVYVNKFVSDLLNDKISINFENNDIKGGQARPVQQQEKIIRFFELEKKQKLSKEESDEYAKLVEDLFSFIVYLRLTGALAKNLNDKK